MHNLPYGFQIHIVKSSCNSYQKQPKKTNAQKLKLFNKITSRYFKFKVGMYNVKTNLFQKTLLNTSLH